MGGFRRHTKPGGTKPDGTKPDGTKPDGTKPPKAVDPPKNPVTAMLNTSDKTIAAVAKPAPTTSDADIAMMGADSVNAFLTGSRRPTNTNPTGQRGPKKAPITVMRALKGTLSPYN